MLLVDFDSTFTGKNQELTPAQREVVAQLRKTFSVRETARIMEISAGAVQSTMRRLKQKGSLKSGSRKGRPKKLGKVTMRWLKKYILLNRKSTLMETLGVLNSSLNINISESSLRRYLRRLGFKGCVAARKPFISGINRIKRLKFAKKYQRLRPQLWTHVIWSDESTFQLFGARSRPYVWRRPGERFFPACLCPTVKHGGGSIMVWGMMTAHGPGPIYRVDGTMRGDQYRKVLNEVMLPAARAQFGRNFVFQQDNAPCHTSNIMKSWFEENSV